MKYGKFTHALSLLATVPSSKGMTVDVAVQAIDHMLEYLHDYFEPPRYIGKDYLQQPEIKEHALKCREMLRMEASPFEDLLETIPPYYSEILFPICVIRHMVRELRMPFNHLKSKHFEEFHNRYGTLICYDPY